MAVDCVEMSVGKFARRFGYNPQVVGLHLRAGRVLAPAIRFSRPRRNYVLFVPLSALPELQRPPTGGVA